MTSEFSVCDKVMSCMLHAIATWPPSSPRGERRFGHCTDWTGLVPFNCVSLLVSQSKLWWAFLINKYHKRVLWIPLFTVSHWTIEIVFSGAGTESALYSPCLFPALTPWNIVFLWPPHSFTGNCPVWWGIFKAFKTFNSFFSSPLFVP